MSADNPVTGGGARRVAGQLLPCGWCGTPVRVPPVGRLPKWCSSSCRHRAWEVKGAAERGLVAVRVVDRAVAVEVPTPQVVKVTTNPRGADWAPALNELAHQLDIGRVYDRDLAEMLQAVEVLLAALSRRRSAFWPRHRP